VVVVVVIVAAAVAIKITEHLPLHTWPSLATFDGCCGNQRTKPANNKTSCDVAVVIVFACQHFWLYIYFLVFFLWSLSPLATFNFIHCRQRQTAAAKIAKTAKKETQTFCCCLLKSSRRVTLTLAQSRFEF